MTVHLLDQEEPPPYGSTGDLLYQDMSMAFEAASSQPAPLPVGDPTQSFWLKTSTSPEADEGVFGPGEKLDDEVDIAIIGSGITGISAAYWLTQKLPPAKDGKQRRIAVFEARDFCSGATGRNGGHCTPASVLAYKDLASRADHLARFSSSSPRTEHWGNDRGNKNDEVVRKILTMEARTAAELLMIVRLAGARARKAKDTSKYQDVEFVSGSNWHICKTPEEEAAFDESIELAKRAGLSDFALSVKKIPRDQWEQRLHQPQDITAVFEIPGSTLHPRRLVILLHTLARAAAEKSNTDYKVHTHTAISKVTPSRSTDGQSTLHTSRGDVKARYVIHAANAYTSHVLNQFAGADGILPTRAQCMTMVPSTSPSKQEPLWQMGFSLNHGFEYLHQRPHAPADNASQPPPCVLGGGRWAAKNMEYGIADDSTLNEDVSRALHPMLHNVFPHNFAAGDAITDEWTAIIGWSRSEDPFVGPVLANASSVDHAASSEEVLPGQFIAAGYSGHGMTRAFSCAEVIVDMIVANLAEKAWSPPSWFPLSYLTTLPPTAGKSAISGSQSTDTGPSSLSSTGIATQRPVQGMQPESRADYTSDAPVASGSSGSSSRLPPLQRLLAAGSNARGQLGLDHYEDSHSWSQCLYRTREDEPVLEPRPFPPAGKEILDIKGGANHTLALLRDIQSGKTEVWRCGDGSKGALGEVDLSTTLFVLFPRPKELSGSPDWQPAKIAAGWEHSYVVYSTVERDSHGHEQDDRILSFGLGRAQSGVDNPDKRIVQRPSLPLPSRSEGRISKIDITQIAGCVFHVALLATWLQKQEHVTTRKSALIGWGNGRCGQLGSWPITKKGSLSQLRFDAAVIQTWSVVPSVGSPAQEPLLDVGREHTVLVLPTGWQADSRTGPALVPAPYSTGDSISRGTATSPAGLVLGLGSDRVSQLRLNGVLQLGEIVKYLGCNWTSTLQLRSLKTETTMLACGKNDKGQWGNGAFDPNLEQTQGQWSPEQLDSSVAQSVNDLAAGSEHSLMIMTSSDATDKDKETSVYGWGWNEHGNLALVDGGPSSQDDDRVTDQNKPVKIWSPDSYAKSLQSLSDDDKKEWQAKRVWAGCATSFLLIEECG